MLKEGNGVIRGKKNCLDNVSNKSFVFGKAKMSYTIRVMPVNSK